ncbi:MAG: xanthine dehydrogenase family protein molybdopterin-binding subunit [Alphaproteobacteria bacterium]
MVQFGVGQSVVRKEDQRLLTGAGRYIDDINLPNQAHAVFVRSPHANARIGGIDTSAAAAAAGVIAVLTAADAEADGVPPIPCMAEIAVKEGTTQKMPPRPVLEGRQTRNAGVAVAMVVAETAAQARDAAELVEVDWEPQPAVTDMHDAMKPGAPALWPDDAPDNVAFVWVDGDRGATEAAFGRADRVVTLELVNNRLVANSMEPRGSIGQYDAADGTWTLYNTSQGAHLNKDMLMACLLRDVEPDKVRVLCPDVGGGFGMKAFLYPETVAVLWAAKRVGRPVKWVNDRSESFLSDCHSRDHITTVSAALDKDCKVIGLKAETLANMGGYLGNFGPYIPTVAGKGMHIGAYDIPAAYVEVTGVFTHTVSTDAYRGAGRPEAAYMIERLMDKVGRETGLGPIEIRRRNLVKAAQMPYSSVLGLTYDSGDFQRNLDDAVADSDWDGYDARRADSARRGKLRGRGLAYYIEVCGGAPNVPALLRFEADDSVTAIITTQSNGQGHETAYSQIIAERLGVPYEKVNIRQGDTAWMKTGSFTGGSRSVPVGGAAAQIAADEIIEKGKAIAADLLEAAPADIEFHEGRYAIAGTDRSTDIFAVSKAWRERHSGPDSLLSAYADFAPEAATFPNGCHIVEVEVDPDSGQVEIVRYTIVDDFGKVINPKLLTGQVHGGVGQGVGQALYEGTVYDADGQLVTGSFMDYGMPRADYSPMIKFRWNEIPCTTNPLGIKGCGEAGTIGAPPAVINAVFDAVADRGVDRIEMPATPLSVWQALQSARMRPAAGLCR